jgi:hypothetical protein
LNNLLKPYHQQPKESAEQYDAFVIYKNLGIDTSLPNKSLRTLARQLKITIEPKKRIDLFGGETEIDVFDRLFVWNKKFNWEERIEVWIADEIEEKNEKERQVFLELQKNSNKQTFSIAQKILRILDYYTNEILTNPKTVIPITNKEGKIIAQKTEYNTLIFRLQGLVSSFEGALKIARQCLGLSEGQFAIFTYEESKTIGSYDENKLTEQERITLYELLTKARTI